MDRYLRSLLISLAGAEQTVNSSLSELARGCLADENLQSPELVREKAGLLALLNLMGILEVFYAAEGLMDSTVLESQSIFKPQDSPQPGKNQESTTETELDLPGQSLSQLELLTSLLTGISEPKDNRKPHSASLSNVLNLEDSTIKESALASILATIPKLVGSKEGGIDPALLAALVKAISSRPKPKPMPTSKQNATPLSESAATDPNDTGASLSQDTDGSFQLDSPEQPGGPVLDPRLLTSLFNFVAGLDLSKSKSTNRQERPAVSKTAPEEGNKDGAQITLAQDQKSIVTTKAPRTSSHPPSLSEFLRQPSQTTRKPASRPSNSHQPGVGIRRGLIKQSRSTSK